MKKQLLLLTIDKYFMFLFNVIKKKVDAFQPKCKKYPTCHEKPFSLTQFFCIVNPSLSSNKIYL